MRAAVAIARSRRAPRASTCIARAPASPIVLLVLLHPCRHVHVHARSLSRALLALSLAARSLADNTCKPRETKLQEFEEDVVFVETRVAGSITSSPVFQEIERELIAVEREIEKDIKLVEREVEKDFKAVENEVVKDVVGIEQEVEKDVKGLFNSFSGRK